MVKAGEIICPIGIVEINGGASKNRVLEGAPVRACEAYACLHNKGRVPGAGDPEAESIGPQPESAEACLYLRVPRVGWPKEKRGAGHRLQRRPKPEEKLVRVCHIERLRVSLCRVGGGEHRSCVVPRPEIGGDLQLVIRARLEIIE